MTFLLLLALAAPDPAYASYLAHVYAADAALERNDAVATRRWLDGAPAEHRGWEWRVLAARADSRPTGVASRSAAQAVPCGSGT